MVAIGKDTFACLAKEAEACATGVADIWAKVQWRSVAAAYRELAQFEPGRTTNAAGQTEVSMGQAKDNPLRKAELYLEQAARVHDLSLNENLRKPRDNLIALAENYYLLHDRFAQLGRLHRSDSLHPEGEPLLHTKLSCIHD